MVKTFIRLIVVGLFCAILFQYGSISVTSSERVEDEEPLRVIPLNVKPDSNLYNYDGAYPFED